MTSDELKGVLRRLKTELEGRTDLDREATELLRELDHDIHVRLQGETTSASGGGLVARAEALETRFEVRHPSIAGIVRELVDALARMGI
jgi:hypothetical protein